MDMPLRAGAGRMYPRHDPPRNAARPNCRHSFHVPWQFGSASHLSVAIATLASMAHFGVESVGLVAGSRHNWRVHSRTRCITFPNRRLEGFGCELVTVFGRALPLVQSVLQY